MADNAADARIARLLHRAHLSFQQHALQAERVTLPDGNALACAEVRSTRFRYQPKAWLIAQRTQQLQAVLTGLRPNFWRSYLDTIVWMSK